MPYISKQLRENIDATLAMPLIHKLGELNYTITKLIQSYLDDNGGSSYDNFNGIIGVLECCKQELYRRLVAPYEDKKKELNGDVFE